MKTLNELSAEELEQLHPSPLPERNTTESIVSLYDSDAPISGKQTWVYLVVTLGSFLLLGLASIISLSDFL